MSSDAMRVREGASRYRAHLDTHDVPPGFKRTEVGVIPVDWRITALGQISSMKSGVGITSQRIDDYSRYPCYGGNGLRGYTDQYTHRGHFALVGRQGALCGNVVKAEGEFFASEHAVVVRASPSTDIDWLTYVLGDMRLNQFSESSAQPGLSVAKLMLLRTACPPTKAEQRAIAEALSDVDGLLGALEALIAKKRAIKRAAMQELLTGKTRLPGFSEEWAHKPLFELLVEGPTNGYSPSSGTSVSGTLTLRLAATTSGKLILNEKTVKRLSEEIAPTSGLFLRAGDILVQRSNTLDLVGTTVYFDGPSDTFIYPDLLIRLRFREDATARWFCSYANSAAGRSYFQAIAAGSTGSMPKISGARIREMSLPYPSLAEQAAIATVLSDMDAEIAALEARRDKTRTIKQGMMQQLLTGRIRLVKTESTVSEKQTEADGKAGKPHSWAFNEAVVISTLAEHFGKEAFPLGRKRYTKLSYLLHRHAERKAEGYLKKAAGPYNPRTKYGGPERIALEKGYIQQHKGPKGHSGFIAADNVAQAEGYFEKWYGPEAVQWLERFRFTKNDELEVLATVDMAAEELLASGKSVDVVAVKEMIASHPEWEAKLDRAAFSDANVAEAIQQSERLFRSSGQRSK